MAIDDFTMIIAELRKRVDGGISALQDSYIDLGYISHHDEELSVNASSYVEAMPFLKQDYYDKCKLIMTRINAALDVECEADAVNLRKIVNVFSAPDNEQKIINHFVALGNVTPPGEYSLSLEDWLKQGYRSETCESIAKNTINELRDAAKSWKAMRVEIEGIRLFRNKLIAHASHTVDPTVFKVKPKDLKAILPSLMTVLRCAKLLLDSNDFHVENFYDIGRQNSIVKLGIVKAGVAAMR